MGSAGTVRGAIPLPVAGTVEKKVLEPATCDYDVGNYDDDDDDNNNSDKSVNRGVCDPAPVV